MDDQLYKLAQQNKIMREALESTRKHIEASLKGMGAKMSTTWNIADKALRDCESLEGVK